MRRSRSSGLAVLVFVQDLHRPAQEDVEPAVHQHLEEPVVARPRHDLEAVRPEDLDVDPARPQPVGELPEVVQRPHGVEPRLLARAHQEDAVAAEAAVDGDADGNELALEVRRRAQVHHGELARGVPELVGLPALGHRVAGHEAIGPHLGLVFSRAVRRTSH